MNIGIIGSGGREHSICYKINKSKDVNKIFCFPGNAGTEKIAKNIDIDISNFKNLYQEVVKNKIELLIVGPEIPLVNGIVDYFKSKNIKIFGPNKKAAQLEGSKIFMKRICEKFDIPSAKFRQIKNKKEAEEFLKTVEFPVVVKSDGLAAGKGVTICKNEKDALVDIKNILNGKFSSSSKVIVEEFLSGYEASYFVITDGKDFKFLGSAQDHKKIGEGDTGLNTGGMGAYSPSLLINNEIEKKIIEKIIKPTLKGMREIKCNYFGILYAGLMIKDNEPKLIEYNIRFGDPECQTLMMRLESDLLHIILSTLENKISNLEIKWNKNPCITVVAASKGYPEEYEKNDEILIKDYEHNDSSQLFHAGTITDQNGILRSNGGRVFNSTVMADNLKNARDKALEILDRVEWKNKYYRRDIGYQIIDK